MITLTAKIDLLSGDNKTLSLSSSNATENNISSPLGAVLGLKKEGKNPFLLGASKLGDGATFSNEVDYFISARKSNSEGLIVGSFYFTITSEKEINNLTIAFDVKNNRHPTKITINGVEYIDDDAIFTVTGINSKSVTVSIQNWNTPNCPIIITGIYTGVSINIDRRNLLSLERTIYDRADLKLPSFGIISNTGRIEFKDLDGEVRDYAEQRLLDKGMPCEIKLNNTLTKKSVVVGKMETDEWDYDEENKTVSVSLKDDLEEWQEINIEGINYDPRNTEEKPFSWLYEYLHGITIKDGRYFMYMFDFLSQETRSILSRTFIKYPMLEAGTLWQAWQKLCEVCQLHIFKNRKGVIECVYNGGN